MTTNPSILAEAEAIVHGDRRASYGTPIDNHSRTAALWSAYLGIPVTARQVCMLNILQKISRDAFSAKRDNLVDIAGYAENANLCAAAEEAYREATTKPNPLLNDLVWKHHFGDYKAGEFTPAMPEVD